MSCVLCLLYTCTYCACFNPPDSAQQIDSLRWRYLLKASFFLLMCLPLCRCPQEGCRVLVNGAEVSAAAAPTPLRHNDRLDHLAAIARQPERLISLHPVDMYAFSYSRPTSPDPLSKKFIRIRERDPAV